MPVGGSLRSNQFKLGSQTTNIIKHNLLQDVTELKLSVCFDSSFLTLIDLGGEGVKCKQNAGIVWAYKAWFCLIKYPYNFFIIYWTLTPFWLRL